MTSYVQAVPYVDRVLIHAEPMERTHLRYAVPLKDTAGALSGHFGEAGVEMQETTAATLGEALSEFCEIQEQEYNCQQNRGRGDGE